MLGEGIYSFILKYETLSIFLSSPSNFLLTPTNINRVLGLRESTGCWRTGGRTAMNLNFLCRRSQFFPPSVQGMKKMRRAQALLRRCGGASSSPPLVQLMKKMRRRTGSRGDKPAPISPPPQPSSGERKGVNQKRKRDEESQVRATAWRETQSRHDGEWQS